MSIKIKDKARKVYLVVGCPGTATSLLARALRRCGVNMGNWRVGNVQESWHFQRMNKRILKAAGGAWYDPPSEEAVMELDFGERIEALLQDYDGEEMWGFKDPRTSLTGKHYLAHLGDETDAYLFCCFRKPDRLLASLKRKATELFDEGFAEEHMNKELIDRYNEGVISLVREFCGLEDDGRLD